MPFLIVFITSFALLQVLLKSPLRRWASAVSNHRSMHQGIVPCFGGVGIVGGVVISHFFVAHSIWSIMILGLILAAVFFLDDLFELPVILRLVTQLAAAVILVNIEFGFSQPLIALGLVIASVWMMNLFNFMDGLDGLAGGMSFIGFSGFAIAAFTAGTIQFELSLIIALASLAFLCWNFHPAKLFLGDVGSIWLGFMISALSLSGWQDGVWSWWFPIVIFLPFIADASVTLIKRILKRENIFEGHKSHYYQRLVALGFSQRAVCISSYFMMVTCSITGLLLLNATNTQIIAGLGALLSLITLIFIIIDIQWASAQQKQASSSAIQRKKNIPLLTNSITHSVVSSTLISSIDGE